MTFSLFSIAILLIFLAVSAVEIYQCVKKGFRVSLVSLAVVLFSVFFAILLTSLISELASKILISVIYNYFELFRNFIASYSWASVFVDAAIGMLLGSVIFVPVFFATRAITRFIVDIVLKIIIKRIPSMPSYSKEKNSYFDQNEKVLSVITGVITSFVITMVITTPIMGTLDVANKLLGIAANVKIGSLPGIMESVDEEEISVCANDFCGNVFYQLGGNLMYYSTASADVYGDRVHLISEVEALVDVVDDIQYTYSALVNPKSATDEQISRIYKLCDNIERLELCAGPLGGFVSNFSKAWQNGELFFGISKPITNQLIEPAFDEMLYVCEYTDYHSARANMITLLKMYATVMESELLEVDFSDFRKVVSYVNESKVIDRLDSILAENPYMSGINLSSIAMAAVSQHILEFNYDSEKYGKLVENITDVINSVNKKYPTNEEKAKVLAYKAQEYIKEYGVDVPNNIATSVAEEMLKHFNGESVTKEDVEKMFSEYVK